MRLSPAMLTKRAEPLIICVNKWDAVEDKDKKEVHRERPGRVEVPRLCAGHVPLRREGAWVSPQILPLIRTCFDSASKRATTGELNRFVETLKIEPPIKIYYITQPASGRRPSSSSRTNVERFTFPPSASSSTVSASGSGSKVRLLF